LGKHQEHVCLTCREQTKGQEKKLSRRGQPEWVHCAGVFLTMAVPPKAHGVATISGLHERLEYLYESSQFGLAL
jgi:hypothetical protein